MKNKKKLTGRFTLEIPIEQIPRDCRLHIDQMISEAVTMYIAFLKYMELQCNEKNIGFSFNDYFEESSSGLKLGHFLDHDNQVNTCSVILAHFCKFIALGYWGYLDLPRQVCMLCNEPTCLGCPYDQSYDPDEDPFHELDEPDEDFDEDSEIGVFDGPTF